jgi:Kef-type K+ transport system membrane component KefB
VLCRILTELKLLDTTVGIVVLSAGVANDVIGWILLALSVALVNAGSGLTALWILLVCVGWVLTIIFPVRVVLKWLARKTGSIENGPSTFYMTVTILVMFGSAFFTDIIGVNAIFGKCAVYDILFHRIQNIASDTRCIFSWLGRAS